MKKAVTIIEVLVVITIIGILTGLTIGLLAGAFYSEIDTEKYTQIRVWTKDFPQLQTPHGKMARLIKVNLKKSKN